MMDFNKKAIAQMVEQRIVDAVQSNPGRYAEKFDDEQIIEAQVNRIVNDLKKFFNTTGFIDSKNLLIVIGEQPEVQLALDAMKLYVEDWKKQNPLQEESAI